MPIHPMAIVDSEAEVASDAVIDPFVVVERRVRIGSGTRLWPGVFVGAGTEIGARCQVHPGAVVGHEPQVGHRRVADVSRCVIGNDNVIRENVLIHRDTGEGTVTRIGHRNRLLAGSLVSHNCQVGDDVVLGIGARLLGQAVVEDRAVLGSSAIIETFVRVGCFARVPAHARIELDVPPFTQVGSDGVLRGLNTVGLRRAGFDLATREAMSQTFARLFPRGVLDDAVLRELERSARLPQIIQLVQFLSTCRRGVALWNGGAGERESSGEVEP